MAAPKQDNSEPPSKRHKAGDTAGAPPATIVWLQKVLEPLKAIYKKPLEPLGWAGLSALDDEAYKSAMRHQNLS